MKRVLLCSLFLGLVGLLLGADDPFAGTWKLDIAKSQLGPAPPGRAVKEETMVIQITGDVASVTLKGTREDGSAILTKYSTPRQGGPVTYTENAPPAGVSIVNTRINERTVEFTTMRDGKEVTTQHVTVSPNGKTLRNAVKGTDAQGKPVQAVNVFQKQ
jgi:hypothetical protein